MARGDFNCPVCGQILGLIATRILPGTDVPRDSGLGGHIHVEMTGEYTCSNAHRFRATGSFLLERVS